MLVICAKYSSVKVELHCLYNLTNSQLGSYVNYKIIAILQKKKAVLLFQPGFEIALRFCFQIGCGEKYEKLKSLFGISAWTGRYSYPLK